MSLPARRRSRASLARQLLSVLVAFFVGRLVAYQFLPGSTGFWLHLLVFVVVYLVVYAVLFRLLATLDPVRRSDGEDGCGQR
ncbi:MAG: hypothetical protein M3Z66_02990 [Chloroflexota bacterium]|nr:hypothetical protein [Chloroflexota bacterium]